MINAYRERLSVHDQLYSVLEQGDMAAAAAVLPDPLPPDFVQAVLDSAFLADLTPLQRQQISEVIRRAEGDPQVKTWLGTGPPVWLLPHAAQVGSCEAERRLLAELAIDPGAGAQWPLRGQALWLSHIRCSSSTPALVETLRSALVAERDTPDVEPLFQALNRCAGMEVLAIYDQLIDAPDIPHARFLYYQRQTALNALVESQARLSLPKAALDEAIIHLRA